MSDTLLALYHTDGHKSTSASTPQCSAAIPASMTHHNVTRYPHARIIVRNRVRGDRRYGVSSSRRLLPPGVLLQRFDHVRDCLQYALGLTTCQREGVLRLLRIWAYYGQVYPIAAQVAAEPGCSVATYWRTVRLLEDAGLLVRINRFVLRPHAQISNLYLLGPLVALIARYLAEHIGHIWPEWFRPCLHLTWPAFWAGLRGLPLGRARPLEPAPI